MRTPRSRIRSRIDAGRLREMLRGPGADTRTWTFYARVDDDPEAVRWDTTLGWLVDVHVVGGDLDGEGPIVCRVAWPYLGDGEGSSAPVARDAHVVCALPEGDPNGVPCVVGFVPAPGSAAPSSVNGQSIDRDLASSTLILRTSHDYQAEVGSLWRTSATDDAKLCAQNVALGDADASQAYVRGDDQLDALNDLVDALDQFAQALATATPAPPNGALTVANVAAAYAVLAPALVAAKGALQSALSSRVKGV